MPDTLNNNAIDLLALYILGKTPSTPSLRLDLFVNDFTITNATVLTDLITCTAPGYLSSDLTPALWTGNTQNGIASYGYPTQNFSPTGPGNPGQTVYGHMVWDTVNDELLWAANWTTAWVIPVNGGVAQVTLTWNDRSCYT